jgi:hypothetical protein
MKVILLKKFLVLMTLGLWTWNNPANCVVVGQFNSFGHPSDFSALIIANYPFHKLQRKLTLLSTSGAQSESPSLQVSLGSYALPIQELFHNVPAATHAARSNLNWGRIVRLEILPRFVISKSCGVGTNSSCFIQANERHFGIVKVGFRHKLSSIFDRDSIEQSRGQLTPFICDICNAFYASSTSFRGDESLTGDRVRIPSQVQFSHREVYAPVSSGREKEFVAECGDFAVIVTVSTGASIRSAGIRRYGDFVLAPQQNHSRAISDFYLGSCRSWQHEYADQRIPNEFDLEFRATKTSFMAFEEPHRAFEQHQTIRIFRDRVFVRLSDKWYTVVDIIPKRRNVIPIF